MLIWILVLIFIVVAVVFYFRSERLITEVNKAPVPAKYATFHEINENYQSKDFKVGLFCEAKISVAASPNPIRIFKSVHDQLIVYLDAGKDEATKGDYQFYKLDRKGNVTDSLYIANQKHWAEFVGSFIVYTSDEDSYFNTWPLNGDTTRQEMVELNTDYKFNPEQERLIIQKAQKHSVYYFFKSFVKDSGYYRQFYFYQDEKWHLMWQKMAAYTNVPDEESADRYRNVVFRTGEVNFQIPKDVQLLDFHPEEKIKYYHVIGGGSGGFGTYNWRGKGYFKTTIANRDFEFMVEKLIIEKEKHNGFKPSLYTVKEAGDAAELFNPAFYHSADGFAFYSPSPKKLYLIKYVLQK